jgi:hypothetical protein
MDFCAKICVCSEIYVRNLYFLQIYKLFVKLRHFIKKIFFTSLAIVFSLDGLERVVIFACNK